MVSDDDAAQQQRFLVGCLVVAGVLALGFVLFSTPIAGVLVMFGG